MQTNKNGLGWKQVLSLVALVMIFSGVAHAATINGRITNSNGNGLGNICVNADNNKCWADWVGGSQTDADGYYSIDLPDGAYYISTDTTCGGDVDSYYVNKLYTTSGGNTDCNAAEMVPTGSTNINLSLDLGGRVSGTVLDNTGTAITGVDGGVTVWTSGDCNNLEWIGWGKIDPADGTFTTSALPPGDYILQTYMNGSWYVDEFWASGASVRDCADADPITVVAGQEESDKEFQLEPGGIISGTVLDNTGTAITGVDGGVTVWTSGDCNNLEWIGWGKIDPADGTFTTSALPPGDYILQTYMNGSWYVDEFWASGASVRDCADADPITVIAGQKESGKEFQLDQGGTISGTIFQADGVTPVTGDMICVDVYSGTSCGQDWQRVGGGCTNTADGTYITAGLEAGDYFLFTNTLTSGYANEFWDSPASTINCREAQLVTVTTGQENSGNDFQLDTGGTIKGHVRDNEGNPLPGITVTLNTERCDQGYYLGETVTDDQGAFVIRSLPSGELYANSFSRSTEGFYVNTYWNNDGDTIRCENSHPIITTEGETTSEINFVMKKGGLVQGNVSDSSGQPISHVWMIPALEGKELPPSFFAETDAEGNYSTVIPIGNYTLLAHINDSYLSPPYFLDEWWTTAGGTYDGSMAENFTVTAEDTISGLDITLQEGGLISGSIKNVTGQPLANSGAAAGDFFTVVDNDGFYHLIVAPGEYQVRAYPYNEIESGPYYVGEWWTAEGGTYNSSSSESIRVGVGEEKSNINFVLEEGGLITGTVISENGLPMENAYIRVDSPEFPVSGDYGVVTDADGLYAIGLLPGQYYLQILYPQPGPVDMWWDGSFGTIDKQQAAQVTVRRDAATNNINFPPNQIIPLTLGVPTTVSLANNQYKFFAFDAQAGDAILFQVEPGAGIENLYINGALEHLPVNFNSFGYSTKSPTARGNYELIISPAKTGTYMFSVFGNSVDDAGASAVVTASRMDALYLLGTDTESIVNAGSSSILLRGYGFNNETTIFLTGENLPKLEPVLVDMQSGTELFVTFDMTGVPVGSYDIVVENPDGTMSILPGGLDVADGALGHLQVSMSSPAAVRPLRNYTCWLEYENDGGADLPAPLFVISNDADAMMRLSRDEPFRKGPIQVLGVNPKAPAGTLSSGSRNRIPIFFKVPDGLDGHELIEFKVEKMTADGEDIDWQAIETDIKPDDIADDVWHVLWANVKDQLGETWYSYLKRLNDDATYLSHYRQTMESSFVAGKLSLEESTDTTLYDVRSLLQFELAKASGRLNPRAILATGLDLSIPTPEIPLSFGRLASQSIPARFQAGSFGRGWRHNYDYRAFIETNGDIIIEDPAGIVRVFTDRGDGVFQGEAGENGLLTVRNETIELKEKNGFTMRFATDGRLQSVAEPNGNSLSFSYSENGLSSIEHSNGDKITLSYSNGLIVQASGSNGKTVVYRYDTNNEYLLEAEQPGGLVTRYSYNQDYDSSAAHALTQITFMDGTHYFYGYDSRGRLVSEEGDNGIGRKEYLYDDQGKVIVSNAYQQQTTVFYGSYGEVLKVVDALGNSVVKNYNGRGQTPEVIGPDGNAAAIAYDGKGNVSGIVDPLQRTLSMKFEHELGGLTALTDGMGRTTAIGYDPNGNMTSMLYPDGSHLVYTYDSEGNVSTVVNRRGDVISYSYNNRGQILQKRYPDNHVQDFTYDERGNLISAHDSLTGLIKMEYDQRNFLTRIEYPNGYWFTFSYDAGGRRTKRTSHDGQEINYFYNSAGALERLTDENNEEIVRYSYDSAGRLQMESRGNGTTTKYTYDAVGQLLDLVNENSEGSLLSRFTYSYDVNGNRTSMTTLDGTTTYEYDAAGQLIAVTFPDNRQISYAYDKAGNRVTVTDDGISTSYTSNEMNQYTVVGEAVYTYDADGNMVSKTDPSGETTYEYDCENRLRKMVTPEGDVWEYTYDALGNRTRVTHNGVEKRYVHDPLGMVDVAAEYAEDGSLLARYVHGLGLVARIGSTGDKAYYGFDGTGHTRQMTDATGNVINRYDYTPFGILLQSDESIPNPFQYVGRFGVMTEANGLNFMRARYYSADVGRFVAEDPIGLKGGKNLYQYVSNNPLHKIDSSGLVEFVMQMAIGDHETTKQTQEKIANRKWHWRWDKEVSAGTPIIPGWSMAYGDSGPSTEWSIPVGPFSISLTNPKEFFRPPSFNKSINEGFVVSIGIEVGIRNLVSIRGRVGYLEYSQTRSLETVYDRATLKEIANITTENITPQDPNEKTATAGVGEQHYIIAGDELSYTIYFENKATASAPAQEVYVTDYLDPNLDWSTFRMGEVAFGEHVVSELDGLETGKQRVILDDMAVDIFLQRSLSTGLVRWVLRTIDLETGELPEDAYAGFLPPNDEHGRGEGYLSFTIKARDDLGADTVLTNSAEIVFDTEAPIRTNEVFNTITNDAPQAPSFSSLADGSMDVPVATVLNWSAVDYATSYDIFIWESGQVQPETPTGTALPTPFYDTTGVSLQYNTTYNWQVTASNVIGSAQGPVWSFTTQAPPSLSTTDNCPGISNPDQLDSDNDSLGDACDNCPFIANSDQNDSNNNGRGDACDNADSDGDGYSDMLEYSYRQNGRRDLDGNPYNPLVQNSPGDDGYITPNKEKNFWILMLPAILQHTPKQ